MVGILAADLRFYPVEGCNARQRLGRNWRACLGEIVELPAQVAPAEGECGTVTRRPGQSLVSAISVALNDAPITAQQGDGVVVRSSGRVGIDYRWRIMTTPRSVIACNRPEVTLFGAPTTRVEHRYNRLIGE